MIPVLAPTVFLGGGPYVGPGDIISGALAFCGLRAYTKASIGSNLLTVRRSSDSTTKTFVSIAGGGINISDAFFDGSTYYATTIYDQTGNGNDVTNTSTPPLFLRISGPGGRPTIQFVSSGSSFLIKTPGATNVGGQPNTGSMVLNSTGSGANASILTLSDTTGGNTAYNSFGATPLREIFICMLELYSMCPSLTVHGIRCTVFSIRLVR